MNSLRLVGGGKPNQGRLQAYVGWPRYQSWGSVCGQGFGANEVTVACRTLGYNYGGRLRAASDFGVFPASPLGAPDTLPIVTTRYACNPSLHSILSKCPHAEDVESLAECGHSQDVALECYEGVCLRPPAPPHHAQARAGMHAKCLLGWCPLRQLGDARGAALSQPARAGGRVRPSDTRPCLPAFQREFVLSKCCRFWWCAPGRRWPKFLFSRGRHLQC